MEVFKAAARGRIVERWSGPEGQPGAVRGRAGTDEKLGPALPSLPAFPGGPAGPGGLPANDITLSAGLQVLQGAPPEGVLRTCSQRQAASPVLKDGRNNAVSTSCGPETGRNTTGTFWITLKPREGHPYFSDAP